MGFLDDVTSSAARAMGRAIGRADRKQKSREAVEQWIDNQMVEEEEIERIYQEFVRRNIKEFQEIEQSQTIQDVLVEIVKENPLCRDFSKINKLPEEYRKSEKFKEELLKIKEITYQQCVDAYLNYNKSVKYIMLMLRPLEDIEEIRSEVSHSLKHLRYFLKTGEDIKSIFTDYSNIEEGMKDIDDNYIFDKELYGKLYVQMEAVPKLFQQGDYQMAFNHIVCADFDESIYDDAKKLLIHLAMRTSSSVETTKSYDLSRKLVDDLFRAMRTVYTPEKEYKYSYIRIPVADMIIADALKYNQSGMIEKIDEELKQFLNNFIINKDEMDARQFEVLRQVFVFLKAYEQEKTVLEFMVINNIPRSEEQEKRLIFLKNARNRGGFGGGTDAPEEIFAEEEEGKALYDYRSLTWNETQIKGYLNKFSNENRTLQTSMVIDEWNNNLEIRAVRWNLKDIQSALETCLENNFGDKFILEQVEAGAIAEGWVDYTDSIIITEKCEDNARYPWIQFIISAEQLTLSQISFSIYTLYNPKKDMQCMGDCFKINSLVGNKLSGLKQKQNPKVNNYISTIKNVIIAELESYLNGNSEEESLY